MYKIPCRVMRAGKFFVAIPIESAIMKIKNLTIYHDKGRKAL